MKNKKISLFITLCSIMVSFSLAGCSQVADWVNEKFPNNVIFNQNGGGITDIITGGGSNTTGGGSNNDGQKDDGSYYSTITDSMRGTTLLNALRAIISSNVSQSYAWSRYEQADEDPNNKSNIITIYARTSLKKTAHVSGNKGWNREHTFPQSKMNVAGSDEDNHIIFASDYKVNSTRGNKKLGVLNGGGTAVQDSYGNSTTARTTSGLFDPGDTMARGLVARSTMYACVMYGYTPTENFESISTMLNWNATYKVSSFEERRNNVVYKNQHNRNPFIDHPEYAARIWG